MGKIQDGGLCPYLSVELNQIQAGTTRPLEDRPRQVLKNSEECSWRRFDNKIVTVLSKGEVTISKTKQIWACTTRSLAEHPRQVLKKYDQ